jgi:hypothetical protein
MSPAIVITYHQPESKQSGSRGLMKAIQRLSGTCTSRGMQCLLYVLYLAVALSACTSMDTTKTVKPDGMKVCVKIVKGLNNCKTVLTEDDISPDSGDDQAL